MEGCCALEMVNIFRTRESTFPEENMKQADWWIQISLFGNPIIKSVFQKTADILCWAHLLRALTESRKCSIKATSCHYLSSDVENEDQKSISSPAILAGKPRTQMTLVENDMSIENHLKSCSNEEFTSSVHSLDTLWRNVLTHPLCNSLGCHSSIFLTKQDSTE